MRFSIFTTLPPVDRSPDQVLVDFREQVMLAEELGFHAVWIGEHHFQPFGGGDLPNAILIGADIAARTSRIRIGQMANIAVWWHPIQRKTLRNIERFGTEVIPHFRAGG